MQLTRNGQGLRNNDEDITVAAVEMVDDTVIISECGTNAVRANP